MVEAAAAVVVVVVGVVVVVVGVVADYQARLIILFLLSTFVLITLYALQQSE